jgi:hypothetical protein
MLRLQTHSAPRPSANVLSTLPPPNAHQPPRQPANDLLGDLGGDPFAQSAGTLNIHTLCRAEFLRFL